MAKGKKWIGALLLLPILLWLDSMVFMESFTEVVLMFCEVVLALVIVPLAPRINDWVLRALLLPVAGEFIMICCI